jgi:hypothetical protein
MDRMNGSIGYHRYKDLALTVARKAQEVIIAGDRTMLVGEVMARAEDDGTEDPSDGPPLLYKPEKRLRYSRIVIIRYYAIYPHSIMVK